MAKEENAQLLNTMARQQNDVDDISARLTLAHVTLAANEKNDYWKDQHSAQKVKYEQLVDSLKSELRSQRICQWTNFRVCGQDTRGGKGVVQGSGCKPFFFHLRIAYLVVSSHDMLWVPDI